MTQKPMQRAEVGMRMRCANKASAECIMRGRGIGQILAKIAKSEAFVGSAHSAETIAYVHQAQSLFMYEACALY